MNEYLQIGERELQEAEELLDIDFCDDGLVFYHLERSVLAFLKALAQEYKLPLQGNETVSQLVSLIQEKTTVKFPQWIEQVLEIEDLSMSDGCTTSICYDIDMYGDVVDAVYSLRDFVYSQVER
ncbi:MAG: hypothetical protein GXN94_01500 [Aquificae bacterium]|nr:hypothetical protein [Aquificota bacterium]